MAEKEELIFEGGTIVACTKCAAAYFGVTAATLSNWMKNGCPRVRFGYWDIRAVTEWRARLDGEKLAEAARTDPSLLTPAQLKVHYDALLKQAQLESAQLRNKIAGGEYLPKSQAVEDLSRFFVVLKASVMGLGRELGQLAAAYTNAEEARRLDNMIRGRINDALEQLSVSGVYDAKTAPKSEDNFIC